MTNPLPDQENEDISDNNIISEDAGIPIESEDEITEPGKTETLAPASDNSEIDKWIGRGLKYPPVENDGLW